LDRRIFFVEEVAWIVGEFILTAEDKVLIVVEYPVLRLIAHRYCRLNSDFKNSRAAAVVKQNT
jgi:hypothetical protein